MIKNNKHILVSFGGVLQMGSSFKKAIFDEHIQTGLVGWAKQAKKKTVLRKAGNGSTQVGHKQDSPVGSVQLSHAGTNGSAMDEKNAGDIVPVGPV